MFKLSAILLSLLLASTGIAATGSDGPGGPAAPPKQNDSGGGGDANGSAGLEQAQNYTMATVSTGLGTYMAAKGAPKCFYFPYNCKDFIIGVGLGVSGIFTAAIAATRSDQTSGTKGGGAFTCESLGLGSACNSTGGDGGPDGNTNDPYKYDTTSNDDPTKKDKKTGPNISNPLNSLPPELQAMAKELAPLAKKEGVDLNDINSIKSYLDKNKNIGGGGDMNSLMASIPPEKLAEIQAKAKEVADRYRLSNVGYAGGGGSGGFFKKSGSGDSFNMDEFMKKLNGGDRGPASVEGLSKNFNGDAVGIASDNIFRMISNRYESKRATGQNFLPATQNSRAPASIMRHK